MVPVVLELDDGELPSDLYWVEGEDLRPILRRVLNVDLNRRRRPIEVELNRKVDIKAGESANLLAAPAPVPVPAPDFFFQAVPAPDFFSSGSGS